MPFPLRRPRRCASYLVSEEGRRTAIRNRTLTPIGCFTNRFTLSAADGERQRADVLRRCRFRTRSNHRNRLRQCDEARRQSSSTSPSSAGSTQIYIVLDIYFGALGSVEHISVRDPVVANIANPAVNFMRKRSTSTIGSPFDASSRRGVAPVFVVLVSMLACPFSDATWHGERWEIGHVPVTFARCDSHLTTSPLREQLG